MHSTPTHTTPESQPPVTLWQAIRFWLKIGLLSFGGPAGQIALMHEELVEKKNWISEKRFLHALNYCMLLPGPEAQQLATYIGWLMHRTWGGVIAGTLFVLPSLILLIALSWVYLAFGDTTLIAGLFYGVKPAVTALVVQAAFRIGARTLKNPLLWCVAAGAFVAIFALHIPFPLIVALAALTGFWGGRLWPKYFVLGSQHNSLNENHPSALIDDNTPIAVHAIFRWSRFTSVLVTGIMLWSLPMAALGLTLGWEHTFTQMAWFFTKAALLTFGGAYAVLPYVYQGAVSHYSWLTPSQMMDGLALGESTPGPLIMVVAFVGFVGAYSHALLGTGYLFVAGATAALLVTWFTFLPSFIFILAGGPLVESTHNKLSFTAPLTAITAAVVGVIVNLALFFSYHIIWPHSFTNAPDIGAAFIALAAAIGLIGLKQNVIAVILVSAVAGLAIQVLIPG